MLNSNGIRELAYVGVVNEIIPIEGYDRIELVLVNDGWHCVVGKGEFKVGDLGILFEYDSLLPDTPPFCDNAFLVSKHYKVEPQKMCKGKVKSDGLFMSAESFGWTQDGENITTDKGEVFAGPSFLLGGMIIVNSFLTARLGVTCIEKEDVVRKSDAPDKYKLMAQRNAKLGKTWWWKWLYKSDTGKKILFKFFGKKRDIKKEWPYWVVKTDEERIQNCTYHLRETYFDTNAEVAKPKWIVTEKIDGTSTTFTCRRLQKPFWREDFEFLVCSRNVVFPSEVASEGTILTLIRKIMPRYPIPSQKPCFYDINYYTQMADKYKVKEALLDIMCKNPFLEWVTIQGETFGPGVQKRDYSVSEVDFRAFNFIDSVAGRWNSVDAKNLLAEYNIPWVPIIDTDFALPDTLDEILAYADGNSALDGKPREGFVFRSWDGKTSFKAVSPEYLLNK